MDSPRILPVTTAKTFCAICHLAQSSSSALHLLLCGHLLCESCSALGTPLRCSIDNIEDPRTPDQRLLVHEQLSAQMTLDEIIAYLSSSIAHTEEHREAVLSQIDASFDFMRQRLNDKESQLQEALLSDTNARLSEIMEFREPQKDRKEVTLKSPLLYTFFPKAGEVGAWNKIEYVACNEFNNVTYLLKPKCCSKLYCCYKCHDKHESHKWQNAAETICLYCDSLQPYQQLPNICPNCKAYHSAMNNKAK